MSAMPRRVCCSPREARKAESPSCDRGVYGRRSKGETIIVGDRRPAWAHRRPPTLLDYMGPPVEIIILRPGPDELTRVIARDLGEAVSRSCLVSTDEADDFVLDGWAEAHA